MVALEQEPFVAGEYDVIVVGAGHAGCEAVSYTHLAWANRLPLPTMKVSKV